MSDTATNAGTPLPSRQVMSTANVDPAIFEILEQNCDVVFWISSPDKSRIDFVSSAFERIFGVHGHALTSGARSLFDFVHPEDRAEFRASLPGQLAGGWQRVYRIIRDDGETRTLRARAFPIHDSGGTAVRVAGVTEDITEFARADDAAADSQLRLQALVDHAADAIFLHDLDGRIVECNRQACAVLGYEHNELQAKHIWDVDASISPSQAHEIWNRLARDGSTGMFSSRHRRKDGTTFPVEIRVRILDLRGERLALAIARDISERHKLIEQSEAFFEISLDLVCIVGELERFEYINPAFERALGLTSAMACRTPVIDLVHPDDLARSEAAMQHVFAGQSLSEFVHRLRHADGSYRWIEWSGRANASRTRIYAVGRDITERRRQAALIAETHRVARVGGWEYDVARGRCAWTDEMYRILELDPEEHEPSFETAVEFYTAESAPRLRDAMEEAIAIGAPFDLELEVVTGRGQTLWVRVVGRVEHEDDRVARVYGSLQDITARHRTEERNRIVMSELDHRVKNTLATVQALADRIASDADDLPEFRDRFEERIQALARTHEIIAATKWADIDLRALIDANLAPYASSAGGSDPDITFEGPSLPLPASAAGPLGMTLHELTTNAVKHGALSCPGARLTVTWGRSDEGFELSWIESGVPCGTPTGDGLGTTLVRGFVGFQLRGTVSMDFTDDGLRCTIQAPLAPRALGTPPEHTG